MLFISPYFSGRNTHIPKKKQPYQVDPRAYNPETVPERGPYDWYGKKAHQEHAALIQMMEKKEREERLNGGKETT